MDSFHSQVAARARFASEDEVQRTTAETVAVLARSLPRALALEVAEKLPGQLGQIMRGASGNGAPEGPDPDADADGGGDADGGDDADADAAPPEDLPAISPDEPFDWGVWGGQPEGEGTHHEEPTSDMVAEASGDQMIDAHGFIGPAINMMETESGHDSMFGGRDLVSVPMGDDAVSRVTAVLNAVLGHVGPQTAARIRRSLPEQVAGWLE